MVYAKVGEYRKLPGPMSADWLARTRKFAVKTVQNKFFALDSRRFFKGLMVRDADGNYYMDWFCGAGVNSLGHAPHDVLRAISVQLHLGGTQYDESVFPDTQAIVLRERLAALAPGEQQRKVFFSNSGTEANEAALKMIFSKRPKRNRIIAFEGAFHGRTGYTIPLLGRKDVHKKHFPIAYSAHHFPFPDHKGALDPLFAQVGSVIPLCEINAVFLELVQGEGGINVADHEELARLVEWCRQNAIYIIVDEVQTGMGRTGHFFACEHFGLNPDIITLAKSLSNGAVPCGATIANAELDFDEQGRHANTNGGNYLAIAAVGAVLDRFEGDDSPLPNVRNMGDYLRRRLDELSSVFNSITHRRSRYTMSKPRGLGLMLAVDFNSDQDRDRMVEECFKRGLIVAGTGNTGIRFLPPLIITREEVDMGISVFKKALEAAFDVNITYTPSDI